MRSDTIVELEGVNGEWFTLAGPDAGDEGVWLSDAGLTGIFDAPVKTVYEEPGNFPGARFLSSRIMRRDIVFAVDIMNDSDYGGPDSWLSRDSAWRRAWSFTEDCTLYVTTSDSGTRFLKLRLGEIPDISLKTDPKLNTANLAKMTCIAGDPFWYEDDVVYSAVTTTNTTFDPNPLPWPWPQEALPTETLHITVDPSDGKGGLNPTDQPVWLKWTVPGSTLPPSQPYVPGIPWLGAPNSPATIWTVPDYSFDSGSDAARRLRLPPLIGGLRTNEVQSVAIVGDASPTGGTWTLTFDGQTTAGIAYNAAASAIKTALENLSNIQVNDTVVTALPQTNEVQEYTVTGGPTGGTYTLTFNGQTTYGLKPNASAFDVQLALGLLSNLGYFNINVTTPKMSNDVQVVQLTGAPSGGYFTLTLDGHTTGHIAYNASALDVENALSALPNVGTFQAYVTQDLLTPFAPWVVTFSGLNVSGVNINQMSAASSLTGGAEVGVAVSTRTEGGTTYSIAFQGDDAGVNVPQMTASGAGFTGGVSPGIAISTDVQGVKPYQIQFQGTLSGLDLPALTMNTSGLTGGTNVSGLVQTVTNGATAPAENAIIDTDPRVEQVVSESGSSLWARMGGVRWVYPVPPWTKNDTFEITVSGAVVGQMVTLRIPRPWSRPWGLE